MLLLIYLLIAITLVLDHDLRNLQTILNIALYIALYIALSITLSITLTITLPTGLPVGLNIGQLKTETLHVPSGLAV